MKKTAIILVMLLPFMVSAQRSKKSKISNGKGALFFHWGYNRSGYTKSNLRFKGTGYDFTLNGVDAKDNPEKFGSVYFDPTKITVPQFNVRIGGYFKDKWAISFGYDHMKYLMDDGNHVNLTGYVTPGLDTVSNFSGYYNNAPIVTDRNELHYENSDGLNYLRAEITRTDRLFELGEKSWLALSSNLGLGAGAILSFNDFRFAGKTDRQTITISGYGLSAHVGLRLEFFRHFYLQTTFSGGFHHQVRVRTRPNDKSASASQMYGYIESSTVGGVIFYLRTKGSGCDSCPQW